MQDIKLPEIIDSERVVLASAIVSQDISEIMVSLLDGVDFYLESHRAIFEVISSLIAENAAVNIISIENRLKLRSNDDSSQIILDGLMDHYSVTNIESYCNLIVDKSICRKIINATHQIEIEARLSEDVKKLVDYSEREIFKAAERKNDSHFCSSNDMVSGTLEKISKAQVHGGIIGVPSFFQKLDDIFGGFESGTFTLLAGRPSMGKSALLVSILKRQCVDNGIPVGVFSLEMKKEHLGMRFLANMAKKNLFAIRQGHVNLGDPDFVEAESRLAAAPIWIDDGPFLTITRLRSSIRKLQKKHGITTFFIDHIGLMQYENKDPTQAMTLVAKGLQNISREFDVAVIGLSQLHRMPLVTSKKKNFKPSLQDLKQSGALEECADVVIFIHRNYYYTKLEEEKNIAELIVEKQRNGPTGSVILTWKPEYAEFKDFEFAEGF